MAAEAKDAQLVQTSRGGQIPSPSNAFFPQKVSLREAQNGEWVDKVDDWAAFWEDDYITYEGADLDDTHDALQTCKDCHLHHSKSHHLMHVLFMLHPGR